MAAEPEPDRAALTRWLLAAAGAAGVLCLFALVAPLAPSVSPYVAGTLAFACVAAEVLTVAALTPPLKAKSLLGLVVPFGLLIGVALLGTALPGLAAAATVTAALLVFGTLTGGVVGRAIEEPGHLLVVAVISALVDVFSVLHPSGPTAQIIQIEAAVNVLILPWPILGTGRIEPVLGLGDIAFGGIYAVASRRHGLSMKKTLIALAVGLAATLAVVMATGAGTPALPFLGAAFVIAHPEARRLAPKDRKRALVGGIVLLAVFGLLFALR
ncbi:MAG: hypothetical protein KC619_03500 [Myxococcales bacterium]|nr:hypothetical protein [Myxococcales bacterium]